MAWELFFCSCFAFVPLQKQLGWRGDACLREETFQGPGKRHYTLYLPVYPSVLSDPDSRTKYYYSRTTGLASPFFVTRCLPLPPLQWRKISPDPVLFTKRPPLSPSLSNSKVVHVRPLQLRQLSHSVRGREMDRQTDRETDRGLHYRNDAFRCLLLFMCRLKGMRITRTNWGWVRKAVTTEQSSG